MGGEANWAKRDRVRELLAAGQFSEREIARVARVSRSLVSSVAQGRPIKSSPADLPPPSGEEPLLIGPIRRCPRCHCLAQLASQGICLACRDRIALAKLRRSRRGPVPMREVLNELAIQLQAPLGLDLRPEDRRRYEIARKKHQLLPFDVDPMPWELDDAG